MNITGVSQTQSSAQVRPNPSAPPAAKSGANAHAYSLDISNSAKAAMQEATETPQQTAQEARSGDRQAQRLQAKEAADENKGSSPICAWLPKSFGARVVRE